jgi:hypothetical protein
LVNDKSLHHSGFYILLALLPIATMLHPLLNSALQPIALYFRTIAIPVLAFILLKRQMNITFWLIFILTLCISSFDEAIYNSKHFFEHFLYIISTIILFRLGCVIHQFTDGFRLGRSLVFSSILMNLTTLIVYGFVFFGIVDVQSIYEIFEPARADIDNSQRFSIGNGINMPLLSTGLCFAAMRITPIRSIILTAIFLNFFVVLISESRVLLVISSLMLLSVGVQKNGKVSLILLFSVLFYGVFIYFDEIKFIFESIALRFSGEDAGSGSVRYYYLNLVMDSMTALNIFFGEGLTSSYKLALENRGAYASVEATALQLLYENGLIGTLSLFFVALHRLPKHVIKNTLSSFILIGFWVQIMFFLPITPLSAFTAFCLGVAASNFVQSKAPRTSFAGLVGASPLYCETKSVHV